MNSVENHIIQAPAKDAALFWRDCLKEIQKDIPEQAFITWFSLTSLKEFDDIHISINVPNQLHQEWLETNYLPQIKKAIQFVEGRNLEVQFAISAETEEPEIEPMTLVTTATPPPKATVQNEPDLLNPRFRFETFIEGSANQLAKAASQAVSENPGNTPYNPLLIYSDTGLGKTHLLQAIGHRTREKFPRMKIVYVNSEKFMVDYIHAIRDNEVPKFYAHYRRFDLLLLDDIQFFEKREQTQTQFFHLFNDMMLRKNQIVLTTDRHPAKLHGLKDRLVSRFHSGLIVDIQKPDYETRIAILQKKAEEDGLEIPYEITEYIAERITQNIREMEGALTRLLAFSSLQRMDITIALAKTALQSILGTNHAEETTIQQVISFVSQKMNIAEKNILGKSRKNDIAMARQVAMFISREVTNSTVVEIGENFGGKDHSTVIHACNNIRNKMDQDNNFKLRVDQMLKNLS